MRIYKEERQSILDLPTIASLGYGYYGGLEIKKIEHGIEDYVVCVTRHGDNPPRCHRVMIKYDYYFKPYIYLDEQKIYLDECLRNFG